MIVIEITFRARFRKVVGKDIVKAVANKEMDRKGFLKYSGLVLLSLIGLKTLASLLNNTTAQQISASEQNRESKNGFGGGRYGV
jgi:hypothetical protein